MKRLILSLLVAIITIQGFSKGVDIEEAKLVAEDFLSGATKTALTVDEAVVFQSSNTPLTYVVNFKPEGWAVVSADDRAPAILGYSNTGYFDIEEIKSLPFYSWFQGYADDISSLITSKAPEVKHPTWNKIKTANYTKAVDPVDPLIEVEWNQGSGWNEYCPADQDGPGGHAYAGCVAVAMAQCMSVYQHPTQGYGSYSFNHDTYGTQFANFGETTYDWASMEKSSPTDAVALLLFHLGVSVNMGYGADASGAFSSSVPGAIKSYFDYSNSAQYISRSDYPVEGEWESILIDQLNNGQPIFYSGDAGDGEAGHAFNIDGVSSNGAFHFNFGWSGSYNGYYFLTSIAPGSSDFTSNQEAVINFIPRNHAPQDITLQNNDVEEGMPAGTIVDKIIVTDETPEDTFTYEVSGLIGFDGEPELVPFTEQDGNLITTEVLNYNEKDRYEIVIKVTDKKGLSFEKNIFVNVDENAVPTNIKISKNEFNDTLGSGSIIGILSTIDEDANELFTYMLSTSDNNDVGKDNDKFMIKNDSLISNYVFTNYKENQCSVYIKSLDKMGESVSKEIILYINKTTGIFNIPEYKTISIYPNPSFDGVFYINMSKYLTNYNGSKFALKIYNLQGQLVKLKQGIVNQDLIQIKMEEKGMYLITMTIDGDLFNQKILIK